MRRLEQWSLALASVRVLLLILPISLVHVASAEEIGAPPLCLELHPVDPDVDEGAPIEVEVRLRNCGSSYVVIPPRIFPEASGVEPEPWGVLTVAIREGEGPPAPYSGRWIGNKLKLPSPEDFLVLGPGYFYGLRVSLTDGEFAYSIQRPGIFTIVAVLRTSARQWLQKISEPLTFDLARVFSGTVQSKPLIISAR